MRTKIDEVNNKFKYDSLLSDLKKHKRKFDKRLNNPHPTWNDDDTKVWNRFLELFEEVHFQSTSTW